MNSRDYWERRAAQDMYDRMGTAEETAAEMNAAINQTSAYLEKEVKAVMRGMQSFGISEAEAKKILNAAGGDGSALQRLRKAAQQVSDPERREALLNAINSAGAYRYRITRIEELNKDINRRCRELYKTENRHVTSALRNVAEDSYYREIFSIQKGTGLGFSFANFSQQDGDRILRSNWVGGNYSQRIWKDVSGMTARLKSELLVSMLSGRSGEKTARIFQEQFGVNAFCARRIVRTESAYVANAAQKSAYSEAGIDRYRFVATLDSRTCECCAALDGKVFDLAKAKPGTNYPPMHPFCRSTTIADFGDDELKGLERRARDKDGNTVKVPADMSYEEWHNKFVGDKAKHLTAAQNSDIINVPKETIQSLDKLKQSGMLEAEYKEYLGIINNHKNPDITRLYKQHADEISKVSKSPKGAYSPDSKSLVFDYPKHSDMNKYGTLAHEYGHFFDAEVKYQGLHFKEIQAVQGATGLTTTFKEVASSSDEFLAAIRKDKEHIRGIYTPEAKTDLLAHNSSHGVQDAIDGLFPKSRINWGHGEKYYNRKYAHVEFMDNISSTTSGKKNLQQVYNSLGLDARSQAKVKVICRQYEAASEAWANIMSAEVCGGESLEYVKKYLPNSYAAMLDILKGVK